MGRKLPPFPNQHELSIYSIYDFLTWGKKALLFPSPYSKSPLLFPVFQDSIDRANLEAHREQTYSPDLRKENKMSKNKSILVAAALTILLVALVVSGPVMDALASNSDNELKRGALPGADEAGMQIYKESKWGNSREFYFGWNQDSLALYHESERNRGSVAPAVSNEEAMAIYHESERSRTPAPPQRLFNGQPFDAYQRSEWLGADR